MTNEAPELRAKAQHYRERADREPRDPTITEAFHEIAQTLERRAAVAEKAVLDGALNEDRRVGGGVEALRPLLQRPVDARPADAELPCNLVAPRPSLRSFSTSFGSIVGFLSL